MSKVNFYIPVTFSTLLLSLFFLTDDLASSDVLGKTVSQGGHSVETKDSRNLTATENDTAVKKLQDAIERHYSYRDLRHVQWKALFRHYRPILKRARTSEEFGQKAAKLLSYARDPHVYLDTGKKRIRTCPTHVNPNYNLTLLAKKVPGWQKINTCVGIGRPAQGIGYILIKTWSMESKDKLSAVFEAIQNFSDTKGLIIDVRPNGGGSEKLASDVAGCFVDKPVVYAKHLWCTDDPNWQALSPQERILKPSKKVKQYRGKIVVLMGSQCMSSCESFLLMMKQVTNCTLIGENSYGTSGNPKPYDLGNGVTVYLPAWKDLCPDGTCLEGQGIPPDIKIKAASTVLRNHDPILEAAIKTLTRPCNLSTSKPSTRPETLM